MKEAFLTLHFPLEGLDESRAYLLQKQHTTAQAQNVRSFDPRTGRARGGQRGGLQKYIAGQINGDASIQDINHITIPYFDPTSGIGQAAFGRQTGAGSGSYSLISTAGAAYVTGGTAAYLFMGSTWDEDGNVYVIYENTATGVMSIQSADSDGAVRWTVTPATWHDSTNDYVQGMYAIDGVLYVFAQDLTLFTAQNRTGVLRFDTDDGAAVGTNPWIEWSDLSLAGTGIFGGSTNNLMAYTQGALGVLGIKSAVGAIIRVINTSTGATNDIALSSGTNISQPHNLTADEAGNFYAAAYSDSDSNSRLWKVGVDGTARWRKDTADVVGDAVSGVAYDAKNHRLGVVGRDVLGTGFSFAIAAISDGTASNSSDYGGETDWYSIAYNGDGGFVLGRGSGTNDFSGMGSDLVEDWAIDNSALYERFFLSCNSREGVLAQSETALNRRQIRSIVVAGGTVKRFDSAGAVSTPTSGTGALSTGAAVIFSAEHSQDLYFADGVSQKFYDSSADTVSAWTASAGTLPEDSVGNRPRLIELWRGRLVQSGLPRDPHNWFMSAVFAPNDWDYAPASPTSTQAVAGNISDAGKVGDIIMGMIPYSDDVLIFGCDHSLWQMSGDPMSGGQIDRISDVTGMAFGRSWCKDPYGRVYFFGSRGGVYVMAPGQQPERISDRIEERLSEVDLNTSIVRMCWDDRMQGLHVFITPLTSTTTTTHYFWEMRTKAWWPDVFANTDHNPKCVHIFDGDDPADRVVLFGSWDGYIRYMDPDANDDDGSAIASSVMFGPILTKDFDDVLLKDLQATLGRDSDDVTYSVYVGETPEEALSSTAVATGNWTAGRNLVSPVRRSGRAIFVKVENLNVDHTWAFEACRARIAGLGKVRRRAA